VSISNLPVANQSFGMASVDNSTIASRHIDGVVGLCFGRIAWVKGKKRPLKQRTERSNSITENCSFVLMPQTPFVYYIFIGYVTVMENMMAKNMLTQPIISIWLGRQRMGGANPGSGGAVIFGGVDTTKYVGNFSWAPITDKNAWKVHFAAVSIGGKDLDLSGDALIDSGKNTGNIFAVCFFFFLLL
jgi:hypothetical protein